MGLWPNQPINTCQWTLQNLMKNETDSQYATHHFGKPSALQVMKNQAPNQSKWKPI